MTLAKEPLMLDLERLIAAVQEHGDEEGSEAQIGDLETLFAVAFRLLSEDQQSRFFADPRIVDLLEILEMGGDRR
jgi:hypothetical protein